MGKVPYRKPNVLNESVSFLICSGVELNGMLLTFSKCNTISLVINGNSNPLVNINIRIMTTEVNFKLN